MPPQRLIDRVNEWPQRLVRELLPVATQEMIEANIENDAGKSSSSGTHQAFHLKYGWMAVRISVYTPVQPDPASHSWGEFISQATLHKISCEIANDALMVRFRKENMREIIQKL